MFYVIILFFKEANYLPAGAEDQVLAYLLSIEHNIPHSVAMEIVHLIHEEPDEIERYELIHILVAVYKNQQEN